MSFLTQQRVRLLPEGVSPAVMAQPSPDLFSSPTSSFLWKETEAQERDVTAKTHASAWLP